MTWFRFFLLLHIFAAIAVFGPAFTFPVIGRFAERDPRNAHLVTEVSHAIETKIIVPGAVVMPFLGLALIYLGHFPLWSNAWLIIAIVLYIIAFVLAAFVQVPNTTKMLRLIESMAPPPGAAPAAAAAAPGGPPAGAPQGPPPAIAAQAARIKLTGIALTVLLVAIIVLMVWHPGCRGICV